MTTVHTASQEESINRILALKTRPEQVGWLVGILEGEGSVIYGKSKRFYFQAPMNDLDVLERAYSLAGGVIYTYPAQKEHHKDGWSWQVHGESALELAQVVLPHLHSRRRSRTLELLDHYSTYRQTKHAKDTSRIENGFNAAEAYLRGEGSLRIVGLAYGISGNTVRDYVSRVRAGKLGPRDARNSVPPTIIDWSAIAAQKTFSPPAPSMVMVKGKTSTAVYKFSNEESLSRIANLAQNPLHLGWLAGLFEGEGSVIFNNKRRLILKIEMTDLDILATVHSLVGGNVYKTAKRKAHHKQAWVWKVDNDLALSLANTLLPYLGVRRTECATEFSRLYVNYRTEKDSAALLRVKRGFAAATEYLKLDGKETLKAVGARYGLSESNVHKYVQLIRAGELPPV